MPPQFLPPANLPRPEEEILTGFDSDGELDVDGLEGYDSSHRAEILAALGDGPVDGGLQTGLFADWD